MLGSKIVVLALALTSAVASAAKPTPPLLAQAKRLIAAEMVDPASVQYRSLRVVQSTVQGKKLTIACGEYNARNKIGGYIGYSKFAYEPTLLQGVVALNAEGDLDLFGESGSNRSETATETKARILAVCLGVPQ